MLHIGRDVCLQENAWAASHCEAVIDIFETENNASQSLDSSSGDYDGNTNYRTCFITEKRYPRLWNLIEQTMNSAVVRYMEIRNISISLGNSFEYFEIMKFSSGKGSFDPHVDSNGSSHNRSLALILYLNDVKEGGELIMPSKTLELEISPKQGQLVILPTDWSHYHYVRQPVSSDRYSIITFLNY